MGPYPGNNMDSEGSTEEGNTLYVIDCPMCSTSSLHLEKPGARGSSAVDRLRGHIRSTTGGGHGSKHTLPEDIDEVSLTDYVERV